MFLKAVLFFSVFSCFLTFTYSGPLSYAICQSGCNSVAVACYAAAGYTFGTVTAGLCISPALIACNSALGACMAACVAAGCSPVP